MRTWFHTFVLTVLFGLISLSFQTTDAALNEPIGAPEIIGGETAEVGEFPFQASIQDAKSGHFCGGSLIASKWVLTAAHCMTDSWKSDGRVVLGMHDREDQKDVEVFAVKNVIVHPRFNRSTMDYDIALIELDRESTHQPITLNDKGLKIPAAPTMKATVTGWGMTRYPSIDLARYLQKVEVPLVTEEVCNGPKSYDGQITKQMLCAGLKRGGRDSCQCDSGGPIFFKNVKGEFLQIGIVSFGNGCGLPDKYGVYTKLDVMAKWIADETK